MPSPSSTLLLALLGTVASTVAQCIIPSEPLSNNITDPFQLLIQSPTKNPIIHDQLMRYRPNGNDNHLVLPPNGIPTYNTLTLDNGYLRDGNRFAVIDFEYNVADNTTKMFMTSRQYATALVEAVYGCDVDTGGLQIRIQLIDRLADPAEEFDETAPGGQIGIQEAGYTSTYEFRYAPENDTLLTDTWFDATMVVYRINGTVPNGTTIADYEYIGCYAEPADGSRALDSSSFADATMSNAECALSCLGTTYFGTEYFDECYCDDVLVSGATLVPDADCIDSCAGDSTDICGGAPILSLYQLINSTNATTPSSSAAPSSASTVSLASSTLATSASTPATSTAPSVTATNVASLGAFTFLSCWAEPDTGRALAVVLFDGSGTMTNEICAVDCAAYAYFGTKYSDECWCGNDLLGTAAILSDCDMACSGDASEECGGASRLSLYQNLAWAPPSDLATIGDYEFYGCVTEGGDRTLSATSLQSDAMTLDTCATFCSGYTYFGTEWSVRCFCGNAIGGIGVLADSSKCSMTCGGDATECVVLETT